MITPITGIADITLPTSFIVSNDNYAPDVIYKISDIFPDLVRIRMHMIRFYTNESNLFRYMICRLSRLV